MHIIFFILRVLDVDRYQNVKEKKIQWWQPWKPFIWFQLGLMYILPVFKERKIRKSGAISTCSLRSNESAKFHKFCKDKFSDLKLGRVEKQQKMSFEKRQNEISSNDSDVTPGNLKMPCSSKSSVLTRRNSNEKNEVAKEHCLFRGGKEGNLYIVSTFWLDAKVRQCARIPEDNFLFSKTQCRWYGGTGCNVSCKVFNCSL